MPSISPIARTGLFRSLTDGQLASLSEGGRWLTFRSGEQIIRQGDPGDLMYFIMRGQVEVDRRLGNGGPHFARLALEEGEFFGEMALLEQRPRTATVTALEPTECLAVNREQLNELLRASPDLAVSMLGVMSRRLRALGA